MGLAQKKVVVRETGGRVAWGYLPASGFLRWEEGGGWVDLMGLDGRVMTIDFNEIEMITTVRDFNLDDPVNPERLGRRSFPARPRGVHPAFLLPCARPADVRFNAVRRRDHPTR